MLSVHDNELLCRVGPGTPMGNLLRQYWIPALPSSDFPEPDGPPRRMRLLGEDLVMFRDSQGRMAALAEACPHRGASLFFGRNEENGLRCVYHGWKFDATGACVDMPNEPAESNFKHKIRVTAYPCRDVNHMVWVYMGPRKDPPPFPAFEINTLPPENVYPPNIMMEEANWVQNLEGDLDSSHLDWLHSRLREDVPALNGAFRGLWTHDRNPRFDVVPTDYGAYYTAKRTWPDGKHEWHRINQFIFPFHTMISGVSEAGLRSFVPLDDHYAMLITQLGNLTRPVTPEERASKAWADPYAPSGGYVPRTSDPRTYFFTAANQSNDYFRDYAVEKTQMVSGIPFVWNLQDRAMTEPMRGPSGEPIYDRTREHLGTTDAMVIVVRRQLLRAAKHLRDTGVPPANVDDQSLNRVRCASILLPPGVDWIKETEATRNADEPERIPEVPLGI